MAEPPSIPFFKEGVSAGFPSPAIGENNASLDLNALCVKHPAATYFIRARGESMLGAGISDGDILVVDRSLSPDNGSIIIAAINGEFTVKRLKLNGKKVFLMPENPTYSPIEVNEMYKPEFFGVVTYVIKRLEA